MKTIEIIIPVLNEGGNISSISSAIKKVFETLPGYTYFIVFVDDGSVDNTLDLIKSHAQSDPHIKFISFSRNFGKDSALKAGIDSSTHDIVITMDGDMQHPPGLIPEMIAHWEKGYQVVYAYTKENEHTGPVRKAFSNLFYYIMNKMSNLEMEKGIADFQLIDKKIIAIIKGLEEYQIFLRGMIKWIGFRQIGIEYSPSARVHGKTAYSKRKLIGLAIQGITSFSTKPLYFAAYLGFVISLLALMYIPYAVFSYYKGWAISGWSSLIVTIAFLGGLQLSILGIMGLYIGKIFMQSKHRPPYVIRELDLHEESK